MIKVKYFGTTSKKDVCKLYEIENAKGTKICITNYGSTLVNVFVKDIYGDTKDVVLGYDNVSDYENSDCCFGGTIGRVANRIRNGVFKLEDKEYHIYKNDGDNSLHSGCDFYNKRVWKEYKTTDNSVTFHIYSADMNQGFPGNADIFVTYTLSEENELILDYEYIADNTTLFNLTNHSYFNLNGHDSGDVLAQRVYIDSDYFTLCDDKMIPTGILENVENTPMDFRVEKNIGKDIKDDYYPLKNANGYDHNYVLNTDNDDVSSENRSSENRVKKVAHMHSDKSGIMMEVYTDLPGLQFYTNNGMKNEHGKNNAIYDARSAACFETQYFPDSIHHKNFPSIIAFKNKKYTTRTVYKFSIK